MVLRNYRNKYKHIFSAFFLVVLMMLCLPDAGNAQFYNGSQMSFGKNRVQYSEFQWTYYRFDQFETYFYLNGKELAVFTAKYAKDQIDEMERRLEVSLGDRIEFIIYNNLSDLKQSNIGLLGDAEYNTGGITHIIGRKVILYFNGNHKHFEQQIRYGIANVLINEMLYGGSLTSQVTSNTLLILPDWYLNGLISYLADGWNTDLDNRIRDGVLSGRYDKFNRLTGDDARYAGQSLWHYIAEEHGENSVPDIVYMTKVSKNVESGFLFVLGSSFKNLVNSWLDYYWRRFEDDSTSGFFPDQQQLNKAKNPEKVYGQVRLSPDGKYLAYTTNELGKYIVWLYDIQADKHNRIFKKGWKLDQKTDFSYPILAWHPNSKVLAFMTEAKGKVYLHYYTPASRQLDKIPFFRFEKIVDFSYSADGKLFVMSAVQKGQSDLFVYNIASRTIDQLSNDIYDDLNPRFIQHSSEIIFASNRPGDTLRWDVVPNLNETASSHDLFIYDYAKKRGVLRRLTNTPQVDERYPKEHEQGYYTYLSDENGIFNRYTGRFDSAISYVDTSIHYRYFTNAVPSTDYPRSIIDYDVSTASGKTAEIVFYKGYYRLNLRSLQAPEEGIESALNPTDYRLDLMTALEEAETLEEVPVLPERKVLFRTVREGETEKPAQEGVDIRNYSFDRQAFVNLNLEGGSPSEEASDTAEKTEKGFVLPKQRNYYVEYSINELVSQVDFTFLNSGYQAFSGSGQPIFLSPGLNALLKVGATDLMEDFRITGGVRLSSSLRNNEYLLSFSQLRSRLDKEMIFHRQVLEEEVYSPVYTLVRHQLHELHYIIKWPFNPVAAIKGSVMLRNDRAVYLAIEEQSLREPNAMRNWAAAKGEFVYDATRSPGMNLYYGMRYKIFGEYYQEIEKPSGEMVVLGMDFRHYTKIHRTLIWANRIAASTSFGSNKLIYYMGGVDNWLFPKFNQETQVDYSQNYAYQTLATNMRGFQQNIRNGNSFVVINTEVRMPVFRYFVNRPLRSDFFNNFQVVAFGDLGTAWTGWNPYSSDNSLFTRVVYDGPITVTIEEQKDPLVGGYGFGVRSRVLGYFLRADWSWGIEDRIVQPGIFYLSLSLDF